MAKVKKTINISAVDCPRRQTRSSNNKKGSIETPQKRPLYRSSQFIKIDECDKIAILNKLREFYAKDKKTTLKKVLAAVNEDKNLPCFSITTFYFMLKNFEVLYKNEKFYTCETCDESFVLPSSLRKHEKIHSSNKKHSCFYCRRSFKFKKDLKIHILTHSDDKFTCDICGKSYKYVAGLRAHKAKHKSKTNYKCSHCGERFTTFLQLKDHLKGHVTSENRYSCNLCDKFFSSALLLSVHKSKHRSVPEKPKKVKRFHSCPICKEIFKKMTQLKRHIVVHKGDKLYTPELIQNLCKYHKCSYCKMAFHKPCLLKLHLLHHTGEKPYSCEKCPRSFYRPFTLKNHQKVHEKDNPNRIANRTKSIDNETQINLNQKTTNCEKDGQSNNDSKEQIDLKIEIEEDWKTRNELYLKKEWKIEDDTSVENFSSREKKKREA